jgi:hypothetical protein
VSTRVRIFVVLLALAAGAPLLPKPALPRFTDGAGFPGWPGTHEGVPLARMSPGPQDAWFARDFPGKVARFAAGDRQVVVRWVSAPTRRLHPASQCFAGAGYSIVPLPMRKSADGALMSCFAARRDAETLEVCEQLRGSAGGSWPDVSAWYWHALAAPAGEAWWSFVVVERATSRGTF